MQVVQMESMGNLNGRKAMFVVLQTSRHGRSDIIIWLKPWNVKGWLYGAVLKKVQVRTMMNDEETGQSDGYHQALIRTSVVFYMC